VADRAHLRHLAWETFPLFPALADHAGPVADLCAVCDPVRHYDTGDLHLFDKPAREILYRLRAVGIKRRERLVQHQETGLYCKGTGKRDPLFLASGKVPGFKFGKICDMHTVHPARDAFCYNRTRKVPGAKAECDIVAHGQVGKYSRVLEYVPDPAVFDRDIEVIIGLAETLPVQGYRSGIGCEQTGENVESG